MSEKTQKFILLTVGVFAMSLVIGYLVLAWSEPSQNPPQGNVPAPLNVGPQGQAKAGGLILNTGGAPTGLIVRYGNVGIGTTAPSTKLHVVGWTRVGGVYAGDTIQFETQNGFHRIAFNNLRFWDWDTGGDMVTFNNGNVGIGTTAPAYKLDIAGDVRWTGTLQGGSVPWARLTSFPGDCPSGQYVYGIGSTLKCSAPPSGGIGGSGTTNYLAKFTGSTTIGNSIIYDNGNVGIGTTAPQRRLHVNGEIVSSSWETGYAQFRAVASNYGFMIRNDNNATYFLLTNYGNPYGGWNTLRPLTIRDSDGSVYLGNVLWVQHGGNVGIGTTAPSGKLSVYMGSFWGSVHIGGNNADLWFDGGSDSVFWISNMGAQTGRTSITYRGTELFTVANNGNVGIGTWNPAYKLEVVGSVGADAYYYRSDITLKENIERIENALEKVLKLEGVTFSWKEDDQKSIGLIAQEVEKIFPELVKEDGKGIKSIDYGRLVAVLIEAIKEQQKEIDSLKKEIENLKIEKGR